MDFTGRKGDSDRPSGFDGCSKSQWEILFDTGYAFTFHGTTSLYIRTDWLKKLNLQPPKTFDDVVNIAKAFITMDPDGNGKNDTYGLSFEKDFVDGALGFLNSFHAYYGIWLKDSSGSLVYSGIQPEMRNALQRIQGLYKDGIIDQEFSVKDQKILFQEIADGKLGIIYGKFHIPYGGPQDLKKKDPNSDWDWYPLLSIDDKTAAPQSSLSIVGNWVVSKNCKNPEALVKMYDLMVDHYYGTDLSKDWWINMDYKRNMPMRHYFLSTVPGIYRAAES